MKKVVISCGPIPARLDAVKYITNRFKGGLAFKTALHLIEQMNDVTVVIWEYTALPEYIPEENEWVHVVRVRDVVEYCHWYETYAKEYDAFVMAAAVANLMPSTPYEGKFPSHNYRVGERFNIEFEIAPRAIDIIKKINPRACLIGYKLFDTTVEEELVEIARHTLSDSKANIIFANTPATAKSKKIAVMADHSAISCTFDEHLQLIDRAIQAEYFHTEVNPLTEDEKKDFNIRFSMAIAKMYDRTFQNGYGTVAIPVPGLPGAFVTTARGHHGDPVLVREVDFDAQIVRASGKATLNAPTLAAAVRQIPPNTVIVHRHDDDPRFSKDIPFTECLPQYDFPGTVEEARHISETAVRAKKQRAVYWRIRLVGHGDLCVVPMKPVFWEDYYKQFPDKYFPIPDMMQKIIDAHKGKDEESLELGSNKKACTKYAYDPYVHVENAVNLLWDEVAMRNWDFVVAKNSVNYFKYWQLKDVLSKTKVFVANTFLVAPEEKVTECEAAILDTEHHTIHHALLLPDDKLAVHTFYAYTAEDYKSLGLKITPYGRNSALLTLNCDGSSLSEA